MSKEQERIESELNECKNDYSFEKEKVRKLIHEVSKLKMDLERANKWTSSSKIVNKPSERTHNEKSGLGFYKNTNATRDLCYLCGNFGHTTIKCPVSKEWGQKHKYS